MWVLKFKIPFNRNTLLGNLCKNHRVSVMGYNLSGITMKRFVRVIGTAFVNGDDYNIKRFFYDIKRDKRLINIDQKDNFMVVELKQHISNKGLFAPGIFHTKPVLVNEKGEYFFEIGSWDKNKLVSLINNYKKDLGAEILSLKRIESPKIDLFRFYPKLTSKQRECLDLAIKEGYYSYPRKITLKKLSEIKKVSYSTFQFHLQNAEKKIMYSLGK